MINYGSHSVLGINVDAVDYTHSVHQFITHAKKREPWIVSALAVHGLMVATLDREQNKRMNAFDAVVPDGQPVRWALNLLYRIRLPDRVYGPTLTLKIAAAMAEESLSVYLYGSTQAVLDSFSHELTKKFPTIGIAGSRPSKFRSLSRSEAAGLVAEIRSPGADAVFLGLGCLRQEVWAFEYRDRLSIPILAVGAAFDFHGGTKKQAPTILGNCGLEWAFRLCQDPKRLWKRYLLLNPLFILYLFAQYTGIKKFRTILPDEKIEIKSYGQVYTSLGHPH